MELDGILRARELLPVFISLDGNRSDEIAQFLLDHPTTGRREDLGNTAVPPRDAAFEEAVGVANEAALALAPPGDDDESAGEDADAP